MRAALHRRPLSNLFVSHRLLHQKKNLFSVAYKVLNDRLYSKKKYLQKVKVRHPEVPIGEDIDGVPSVLSLLATCKAF